MVDSEQSCSRYQRAIKRHKMKSTTSVFEDTTDCNLDDMLIDNPRKTLSTCDASTQVAFEPVESVQFSFECSFENQNVRTQVTSANVFHGFHNILKSTSDKSCGPDSDSINSCLSCDKFHGFNSIKNENSLKDLTGITYKVFDLLCSMLPQVCNNSTSKNDRLLIFLIKIKHNLTFSAIGVLFKIHRTSVSRIFFQCLEILSIKTKNLIFWPSKSSIKETLPVGFKKLYPNTRCIIDCTEIKVEQPPTVEQRVYMYSRYKGCNTVKFLAAITPSGAVSFISKCYGGRASDSFITNDSGFLSKLELGDQVLAEEGFPGIKTNCENKNAILVMPPVLHHGRFTEKEILETYTIASIRIHVERFFARLKSHGVLNKIQKELLPHIDDIVHMCCVLTNLQPPIIKNDEK